MINLKNFLKLLVIRHIGIKLLEWITSLDEIGGKFMEKQDIINKFDEICVSLLEVENEPDILEYLSEKGHKHLAELREELFCLINSDLQQHEYSDDWFLK